MTSESFLELFASLSLQTAIVILLTSWLSLRTVNFTVRDRLWQLSQWLILTLTAAGVCLPHYRWMVFSSLVPDGWQSGLTIGLRQTAVFVGVAWAISSLVSLLRLVWGIRQGHRIVSESSAPPGDWLVALLPDGRLPRVCMSDQVSTPFLWQLHDPAIVLPVRTKFLPQGEVQAILRHELAHLRAGHPVQLFVQRLVEVLYWFHPLVWRASRSIAVVREVRCDEQAARTAAEARDLLNGLTHFLEDCSASGQSRIAVTLAGTPSILRERIIHLLHHHLRSDVSPQVQVSRSMAFYAALTAASLVISGCLWLPISPTASPRSPWSPWPRWSAQSLDSLGIEVRDYEIDGHRWSAHTHLSHTTAGEAVR